jgi:hypothetical protein
MTSFTPSALLKINSLIREVNVSPGQQRVHVCV